MSTSITSIVAFVRSVRFDMKSAIAERNPRPSIEAIVVRVFEEPSDTSYDYLVNGDSISRASKTCDRVMLRHIKQCRDLWNKTNESVMPPPVQKDFHEQGELLQ
jgi:hypothetical protein